MDLLTVASETMISILYGYLHLTEQFANQIQRDNLHRK